MKSTTFNEKLIPQINLVLKFVLENPYSDFYRKKYNNLDIKEIKTYKDFEKIPFLEKDEILAEPIENRTFLPENEISHYSFSSGTTKHLKPTIIPVTFFSDEDKNRYGVFNAEKIKILKANKLMILLTPTAQVFNYLLRLPYQDIKLIPGDVHNLTLMANIVSQTKIKGFITTQTILDSFIDELNKVKYDLTNIKWITLSGEFCSSKKYEYFKSKFPQAYFNFGYGSSESSIPRFYRCNYLAKNEPPNIFHLIEPLPEVTEIINDDDELVSLGEMGEMVYTSFKLAAFPIIRYKTRDMMSLNNKACLCKNKYNISIGGKIDFDVFKFYGVTLYTELISAAIHSIKEFIQTKFQVHVYEEMTNNKLKPRIKIHLILNDKYKKLKSDIEFKNNLEKTISDKLHLANKKTLNDLVKREYFLPLEIIFVDQISKNYTKSKNIISHLT